jgi:hypothetical protein
VWCFGTQVEPVLLVTVDQGSICVHEMESDHDVKLRSTSELVSWLNAEKPGSLQPQRGRVADKAKRATLFRWD